MAQGLCTRVPILLISAPSTMEYSISIVNVQRKKLSEMGRPDKMLSEHHVIMLLYNNSGFVFAKDYEISKSRLYLKMLTMAIFL